LRMNVEFLALIRFRGLGELLGNLAEVIPEFEETVRSIYLGPVDERGVREGLLELEIEPSRLSRLISKLSGSQGILETRVERFPALVLRDTSYHTGEE